MAHAASEVKGMSLAEIWYSLRDSAVDRTVFSPPVVEDPLTEANEIYQNAGEQGRRQDDSDDPHRR